MIRWLVDTFHNGPYLPHVFCLLEQGHIVWAYAAFHLIICVSYFWIGWVCYRNKVSLLPGSFGWMFGLFIFMCGFGHGFRIYTLFSGLYNLEVMIDGLTAAVSASTGLLLIPSVAAMVLRLNGEDTPRDT